MNSLQRQGVSIGVKVWLITVLLSPIMMEIQNQVNGIHLRLYGNRSLFDTEPVLLVGYAMVTFFLFFLPCILTGLLMPNLVRKVHRSGLAIIIGIAVVVITNLPFIIFSFTLPDFGAIGIIDVIVMLIFQIGIWYWAIGKLDPGMRTENQLTPNI